MSETEEQRNPRGTTMASLPYEYARVAVRHRQLLVRLAEGIGAYETTAGIAEAVRIPITMADAKAVLAGFGNGDCVTDEDRMVHTEAAMDVVTDIVPIMEAAADAATTVFRTGIKRRLEQLDAPAAGEEPSAPQAKKPRVDGTMDGLLETVQDAVAAYMEASGQPATAVVKTTLQLDAPSDGDEDELTTQCIVRSECRRARTAEEALAAAYKGEPPMPTTVRRAVPGGGASPLLDRVTAKIQDAANMLMAVSSKPMASTINVSDFLVPPVDGCRDEELGGSLVTEIHVRIEPRVATVAPAAPPPAPAPTPAANDFMRMADLFQQPAAAPGPREDPEFVAETPPASPPAPKEEEEEEEPRYECMANSV